MPKRQIDVFIKLQYNQQLLRFLIFPLRLSNAKLTSSFDKVIIKAGQGNDIDIGY